MLGLTLVAFTIAWWLGLYLLGRDPWRATMRRAGLGLLAYALALAFAPFDGALPEHAHEVLAGLPALIWSGVLIALLPADHRWRARADRLWSAGAVPAGVTSLVLATAAGGPWRVVAAAVVLAPLLVSVAALIRARRGHGIRDGLVILASLLFGLGVAALLMPMGWLPDVLVIGAIGVDLLVLGAVVAASNAVESGEALATDLRRSAMGAGLVALVLGGQFGLVAVGTADPDGLLPLAFGVVGTAVAVVTLASPLQAVLDRLVFAGAAEVRTQRAELRDAADALPRRNEHERLAKLDDDGFARLVREALRHYGDLGKLLANPLTALPAIDKRLVERGREDHSLDRAIELKAMLLECIERLKPPDQEFGTSEEWRHYNALYFPYVAGLRPYRRQPDLSGMDETSRRAFDWFRRYVPERTLYNWQNAATRVVAADLRTRDWQ
ncbi:hypothetical protein [Phytoactinopolyspora halotolerans]|uniref:Uncharacterized protein n=1 Tax=Phytoactinopolyspora halotolerans TaxID=1981512 RepID=A0A6L9SEA0_9ACTN|nr:hypothetical protein [Phytoactinopolyspora halotolerans]NEE03369.1 hypothetical protein [Phytoactinopolyspora halotolerans]